MIINHNISAIFSNRQLTVNNWDTDKSIEKLSSGMRINRAGDDASGLAVSEKMRTRSAVSRRANQNVQDGISLIQTAEGYLEESGAILQRLRELAVQASNGIYIHGRPHADSGRSLRND
jgi:flagellin